MFSGGGGKKKTGGMNAQGTGLKLKVHNAFMNVQVVFWASDVPEYALCSGINPLTTNITII